MRILLAMDSSLLQDFGNHAGTHRTPAFANGKPQLLFQRDRRDQLDRHLRVIPRHHHLHPGRQLHTPRHVRRPEVELRPIPLEERGVAPTCASSSSLRNISTPVTTVFLSVPKPTISSSSPDFTLPRSTRPVATVPRPVIENTSSTGIRNGLSSSRLGIGIALSSALSNSSILAVHCLSPSMALSAAPRITGTSSPGN